MKEKNYKCGDCSKSYLSFPALYTHRRNKHNIIPVTGKQEIFKSFEFSMMNNFSYSSFGSKSDLTDLVNYISLEMKLKLNHLYLDPSSVLFNKEFQIQTYPLLYHLDYFQKSMVDLKIPKKQENHSIDRTLSLYLLLLNEVTRESFFTCLSIQMVVLLRHYLNLVGWENLKSYHDFQIYNHQYNQVGEYTSSNNPEEILGLINDFVTVFLDLDKDNFGVNLKNFLDLVHNFCNWLFINDSTNYKVLYVEDEKQLN